MTPKPFLADPELPSHRAVLPLPVLRLPNSRGTMRPTEELITTHGASAPWQNNLCIKRPSDCLSQDTSIRHSPSVLPEIFSFRRRGDVEGHVVASSLEKGSDIEIRKVKPKLTEPVSCQVSFLMWQSLTSDQGTLVAR